MLRRLWRAARHYAEPKALVLMYHRVAEPETDAWELAVTPARFEEHLQALGQAGRVMSAPELARRLASRTLLRRSVVLTFDDGYADNYHVARPLLARYQVPATFFIPSGSVGQVAEFWWDELEAIFLLSERLPGEFSLQIGDAQLDYDLSDEQELSALLLQQHRQWRAAEEAPPTRRAALYYRVWELMRPLPAAEQQQQLRRLRAWAAVAATVRPAYQCVSAQQLRGLSRSPLFTIGAHTATHLTLASHPAPVQAQEMQASRQALRAATGQPVGLLAYPYGDHSTETTSLAARTPFDAAFTTQAQVVTHQSELYRLGRLQVKDWAGEEFRRVLSLWLR